MTTDVPDVSIDIVCGRPEVGSHKRICVERFQRYERTGFGPGWAYPNAAPGNYTAAADARLGHTGPHQDSDPPWQVTCPLCGLNAQRRTTEIHKLLDRLAETGVSEVSISGLVAIFT